jgi:membrane protein required for colicin V production
MNWLDVVVILVIVAFTLAAFSAGLIREVITLVAVIAGIVIAGALYEKLAKDVLVFIDDDDAAQAIAFLALFGGVYLMGQIGAYVLKTGAALLMLGPVDHVGGAVFGFIKGIFVVEMLLIILAAYPSLHIDSAVDDSTLARHLVDDYNFLKHILPSNIDDRVANFLLPPEDRPGNTDGTGDDTGSDTPTPEALAVPIALR